MSHEVNASKRARQQILTALRWWYRHRDKAPLALAEELDALWNVLEHSPDVGQIVRKDRGIRRVLLERVHYYVYYRMRGDTVEIMLFWHASRRPPRL